MCGDEWSGGDVEMCVGMNGVEVMCGEMNGVKVMWRCVWG